MVCAKIIGNDATIAWAGASGSFELNVAIPVMGTSLLESIRLLANSARVLADKTITGLEANADRAAALAGMSPAIVTPLNRIIGYEAAAAIAKHSVKTGITVRESVIELGYVERGEITLEQLDKALDLLSMTSPGVTK
jgi:fumarate hydratase class II